MKTKNIIIKGLTSAMLIATLTAAVPIDSFAGWSQVANLKGPQGAPGMPGTPGATGAPGTSPTVSAVAADLKADVTTNITMALKSDASFQDAVRGATGGVGPQGATGAAGATGAQGTPADMGRVATLESQVTALGTQMSGLESSVDGKMGDLRKAMETDIVKDLELIREKMNETIRVLQEKVQDFDVAEAQDVGLGKINP